MKTAKLGSDWALVVLGAAGLLGALGLAGCKVGTKTESTMPGGGGGAPVVMGTQPGGAGGAPRSGPPTGAQAGARAADDAFTGPLSIEGLSQVQIWDLLVAKGHRGDVAFKISGEEEVPRGMRLQGGGPEGLNTRLGATILIDGPVSDAATVMPQLVGLPVRAAIEKLVAAGIIEFEIERVDGCAAGTVCATPRRLAGAEGKYYAETIEVGR
ncbi:MAG: hypothetical protein IT370_14140 [Deltaproteobacteria bacterium]|nr:hypothetical protein [Deltaproteobacteria bacterium]